MGSAIAALIPLSVGIAANPIPIIIVVLILQSPGGRAKSLGFLGVWLVGLAALAGIILVTTNAAEAAADDGGKRFEAVIRVALGLFLLYLAAKKWAKRPGPDDDAELPKWMSSLEGFNMAKTLGLSLLFTVVNPKHIALIIGAMFSIAQANLATSATVALVIIFILLSSAGVGVPVIYALVGGKGAESRLRGWKDWLSVNNAAILAVLFLVFGVVLLSKGLGDLIG